MGESMFGGALPRRSTIRGVAMAIVLVLGLALLVSVPARAAGTTTKIDDATTSGDAYFTYSGSWMSGTGLPSPE